MKCGTLSVAPSLVKYFANGVVMSVFPLSLGGDAVVVKPK